MIRTSYPRILAVDDDDFILEVLVKCLKDSFEVVGTESPGKAIHLLNESAFDILLADINMEEMNGLDLIKAARDINPAILTIIITGYASKEIAVKSIKEGAYDFIEKPFDTDIIIQTVKRAWKALLVERESERYRNNLDAIFRSLNDAVITVDNNMRVIEANEATANICGIFPEEILEKKIDRLHTKCNSLCHKAIKETLKTKRMIREYRVMCGHSERPGQVVQLTCTPLVDRDSKHKGAVFVIRDFSRVTSLEMELKEKYQFNNIIGKSHKMQQVYTLMENLFDTDTTVLITGESGTGKELVAKAIHYNSIRAAIPMVTVNCGALSEGLLESELFGHVKGAFTGAVKDKAGRFQMADGSTIFLDEIGDISPLIQLKLLRVLQERNFERVGDSKTIEVDVRILAATNSDLKENIRLGIFREDLYYRLNVVEVKMPPLRERNEDIPLLANHFCDKFNERFKKHIDGISGEAMNIFMRYHWPGNVRELEHAIEHAFVLCQERVIMPDHLPSEISERSTSPDIASSEKYTDEKERILQALNRAGWNKAKAARRLGLSRQGIYRKIARHNIVQPPE